MIWSDFRAQLRRELEEPVEGVWADASLLYWCNAGADDIAIRTKCLDDEVYADTVVGQYSYDLPDNTLEVAELYHADTLMTREGFQAKAYRTGDTGTPRFYCIRKDVLYLRPTPTEAAELRFFRYRLPEDIDDDNDSMPFGDRYNPAIAYYIKAKAFEQISDFQAAGEMLARYDAELDRIAAQEAKERSSGRSVTPREVW